MKSLIEAGAMRGADRAVGSACVLLSVIGMASAFMAGSILFLFSGLLTGMGSGMSVERQGTFNMNGMNGGMITEQPSSPSPFIFALFILPSLIFLIMGIGVFRGVRWGFHLAIFLACFVMLAGASGGILGVFLAAYSLLRIFQLGPQPATVDSPAPSPTEE